MQIKCKKSQLIRGEGYIDVVVSVLVVMMLLVLTLNIFQFLTLKQDLDYFAKQMIASATVAGKTTAEPDNRYQELAEQTGLKPEYSWEAEYYNDVQRTVQYGDPITIKLKYHTKLQGFGVFQIPVTLTVQQSGLSRQYWKGAT